MRRVALFTADLAAFCTAVEAVDFLEVVFLAVVSFLEAVVFLEVVLFFVDVPIMDLAAFVAILRAKEVAAAAIIVPKMVRLMPDDFFSD